MEKKRKMIISLAVTLIVLIAAAMLINEKMKNKALNASNIPTIKKDFTGDIPAAKTVAVDAVLSFDQEKISAVIEDGFNLIARVNPGSNTVEGVNAVQLDIAFNPSSLQLSEVLAVSPFTTLGAPTIDNEKGTLSVALFIGGSQVMETSDVATLSFKSKKIIDDSPIVFAASADATINDGMGSMVVGTRSQALITVLEKEIQ